VLKNIHFYCARKKTNKTKEARHDSHLLCIGTKTKEARHDSHLLCIGTKTKGSLLLRVVRLGLNCKYLARLHFKNVVQMRTKKRSGENEDQISLPQSMFQCQSLPLLFF